MISDFSSALRPEDLFSNPQSPTPNPSRPASPVWPKNFP